MKFGAGTIAAERYGAKTIIDPRAYIKGKIKETFEKYPNIGPVLPAMGYGPDQIKDLETTINNVDCDLVLFGTPIDLPKLISIEKPTLRVKYEYRDHDGITLKEAIESKLIEKGLQ
jgi:predicted GTPase